MPPLATIGQDDFAAGMVRSVARHLIPANGFFDGLNLLVDDDGSAYRRGGSRYRSAAPFGAGGLRWIWDGRLAAGRRTVFANGSGFGVLAADDRTAVSLGGAGLAAPAAVAVIGGVLHLPGGVLYAGSRKAANYSTGSVAVTQGSATVTGTSTVWRANVDQGMLLAVGGGQPYVVQAVASDTSLTLDRPFMEATGTGRSYVLSPLGTAVTAAPVYAAGGDRLITASGNAVRVSMGRDPSTGQLRYGSFDPTDAMQLPDGVEILGAAMARDLLIVFATEGVWAISNMAMELTDDFGNVQRRLDKVTGDIVLWGSAGIASWQNALVVPTLDGVVLVDGVSQPTPIARSITPLLADYVRAGYQPGGAAVYANHYFLPVLDSAGGSVVDLLVCRLDRPVETRLGVIFPWTRLGGHGGSVMALTQRVGGVGQVRSPELLAAGADGRVLDVSKFFRPDSDGASDADGTAHQILLESRDFATGAGNLNHVQRLRLRYEFKSAGGVGGLVGRYSIGSEQAGLPYWGVATWGDAGAVWTDPSLAEFVLLRGSAPASTGRDPFVWRFAARTRFIRGRVQSSDPAALLVLRSLEWGIRPSAKDR